MMRRNPTIFQSFLRVVRCELISMRVENENFLQDALFRISDICSDYFCELVKVFLFEENVSSFFILFRIPILMILCWVGKRNNNLSYPKYVNLSKSCRTSSTDSNIGIWEDMSNIFLRNPFDCLAVWNFTEFILHIAIKLPKCNNPLVCIISWEALYNLFEYYLGSLASADYKYMLLGGFPIYGSFLISYFSFLEYWWQYLSDIFTILFIEIFSCTFKTKKYSCCDSCQYTIRSSRYCIRLMDIERNS